MKEAVRGFGQPFGFVWEVVSGGNNLLLIYLFVLEYLALFSNSLFGLVSPWIFPCGGTPLLLLLPRFLCLGMIDTSLLLTIYKKSVSNAKFVDKLIGKNG